MLLKYLYINTLNFILFFYFYFIRICVWLQPYWNQCFPVIVSIADISAVNIRWILLRKNYVYCLRKIYKWREQINTICKIRSVCVLINITQNILKLTMIFFCNQFHFIFKINFSLLFIFFLSFIIFLFSYIYIQFYFFYHRFFFLFIFYTQNIFNEFTRKSYFNISNPQLVIFTLQKRRRNIYNCKEKNTP